MADGEIENTISSSLNTGSGTGAAVEVKFEKNPIHTQKYLEAEPKALGVTQIMLSLFVMSIVFCTPLEEQMYFMTFKSSLCSLTNIIEHVIGIEMLMYLTQFAISATLAGFCCKVIQCCTVRNSVPVIMLNAPRGPQ
ncbi:hypothetical protein C0J45_5814 [Silurus meridionalis]|nr:hypothetical protein C0J45_5814 [Silurus meridionalis]